MSFEAEIRIDSQSLLLKEYGSDTTLIIIGSRGATKAGVILTPEQRQELIHALLKEDERMWELP